MPIGHVAVVAATLDECTRIAGQLADFLAPDFPVETRTVDAASVGGGCLDDIVGSSVVLVSGAELVPLVTERRKRHADVIPVHYTLTKKGWRKVIELPRGASVAVTGETLAAAVRVAETLRRLEIDEITLSPMPPDHVNGRKFDFLLVSDLYNEPIAAEAERLVEVGPLMLSPAVIVDLLNRLGRYDEAANVKLEQYFNKVKLVHDDYTGLLDIARYARQQAKPFASAEPGRKRRAASNSTGFAGAKYTLDDIIGKSTALKAVKGIVERFSDSLSPVVIHGETGTGKEMFAHAIHNISPRKNGPFVVVNCVAIPESLAESELFGYEEGAFTGAKKGGKEGLLEQAQRGTIFLDEINDMPIEIQARLLRFLEDCKLMRVGGLKPIEVDVRVVAATNRSLEQLVKLGRFRQDLYFRLCVIPLHLPPLRERVEDIPLLVHSFLAKMGGTKKLSDAVFKQFMAHPWPGNVRELKHCLEYMWTAAGESPELDTLPPHLGQCLVPTISIDAAREAQGRAGEHIAPHEAGDKGYKEYNEYNAWHGDGAPGMESGFLKEDIFLLSVIHRFNSVGCGIGRRCLAREASRHGVILREGGIRTRLSFLRARGFVNWGLGRSGIKLTAQGQQLLAERRNHFGLD